MGGVCREKEESEGAVGVMARGISNGSSAVRGKLVWISNSISNGLKSS